MKEIYNGETVALGGVNLVTKQVVVDDSTGEKAKFTYDKTTGAVTVLDTVDPDSVNPVTARAVATAVASASGEVPIIGDDDNGKVLKAVVDGSSKSVAWGEAASGLPAPTQADAGKVLQVNADGNGTEWAAPSSTVSTSGVISGDGSAADPVVLNVGAGLSSVTSGGTTTFTVTDIVGGYFRLTREQALAILQSQSPVTVNFTGNGSWECHSAGSEYIFGLSCSGNRTVFFNPLRQWNDATYPQPWEGDVSAVNYVLDPSNVDTTHGISVQDMVTALEADPTIEYVYLNYYVPQYGYWTTCPDSLSGYSAVFTVPSASGATTSLVVTNPVPASTQADATKVLTVDNTGAPVWASAQAPISAGNGIDITNNVVSVDTSVVATQTDLASKQDTISDLATIRSGAAEGATAVQPGDLATVATTGSYDDLSDKPTIPAAQVNSDWNASSGVAEILNKPANLVQDANYVHTDENFTSAEKTKLSGIAAGAEVNVQADWTESDSSSDAYIANKPALATVATTGAYSDLSGTPTINNVPAVTSSDNDKVLKASYSGDVGSYSWQTEHADTAGDAIDISNDEISVLYDSDTLKLKPQEQTYTFTLGTWYKDYSRAYVDVDSNVKDILEIVPDKMLTIHIPGNTFSMINPNSLYVKFSADSYFNHAGNYIAQELSTTFDSDTNTTWVDEQDIVVSSGYYVNPDPEYWHFQDEPEEANYIGIGIISGADLCTITSEDAGAGVTMSFSAVTGDPQLAVKNPLPASTKADAGKVLTVDDDGDPEWSNGWKQKAVITIQYGETSYDGFDSKLYSTSSNYRTLYCVKAPSDNEPYKIGYLVSYDVTNKVASFVSCGDTPFGPGTSVEVWWCDFTNSNSLVWTTHTLHELPTYDPGTDVGKVLKIGSDGLPVWAN